MKKIQYLIAFIAAIFSFIIYILTAAKDLQFTDSGELAAVSVTLGIAHPSGYPLFTILGHIWSYLPINISKIYLLNILAGIYTSLSVLVFYFIVYTILNSIQFIKKTKKQKKKKDSTDSITNNVNNYLIFSSLIATLIYSFSITVWSQATNFEVYSLQLLLINLVILLVIKAWQSEEQQKQFYLIGSFVLGLSFTNHLTTILIVPAVLFLYFKTQEKFDFSFPKLKFLFVALLPLILGLSLYLYLPIRSAMEPDFNWGWVSRSFDKFWYHVTGKQYQVWMFSDAETMKKNISLFFQMIPSQFGWIGIIPLVLGLFQLIRYHLTYSIFLLLISIAAFIYVINYSIHDIDSYFTMVFIPLHIFAAVGIYWLFIKIKQIAYSLIIIPIISIFINYESCDLSNNFLVREYTNNLINNLDENALIISAQWDYWCSAFWYMQKVEKIREDIVLVEKELLRRTWYPYQFKKWYPEIYDNSENEFELFMEDLELFEAGKPYNPQRIQARFINLLNSFIDKNINERPIYITIDILQTEPDVGRDYEKIPEGFAIRLLNKKEIRPVNLVKFDLTKFQNSFKKKENHLEEGIRKLASSQLSILGNYALSTQQYEAAQKSFEMALKLDRANLNAIQGIEKLNQLLPK